MNFFNDVPDGKFYDFEATKSAVRDEYHAIQGEPEFGDIVWFLNSKGDTVHIAVYVAADYLFTKNGADYSKPWLLMDLKDLLAFYSTEEQPKIVIYRRNGG
jgi:hypothetical protein